MEREGAFSFCRPPRPLVLSPPPPASPSPNQWSLHTLNHLHGVSLPGSSVDHDQLFFLPNWTNLTGELREERERGWFSRMAGEEEGGWGRKRGKISTKSCEPRGMTTNYSWIDPRRPPQPSFTYMPAYVCSVPTGERLACFAYTNTFQLCGFITFHGQQKKQGLTFYHLTLVNIKLSLFYVFFGLICIYNKVSDPIWRRVRFSTRIKICLKEI